MPNFSSQSDICRLTASGASQPGSLGKQAGQSGRGRKGGLRGRAGSQRCPNDRATRRAGKLAQNEISASFRTALGLIGVPCTAWDRGYLPGEEGSARMELSEPAILT